MVLRRRSPPGLPRLFLGAAALAITAFSSTGCTALVDLDGLSGGKADAGTAGDGGPMCAHDRWPGPPASATEGGMEDFYAAIRIIDLGETKPDVSGFDLDGLCTCITDGPSCGYPKYAPGDHCDAINGRDNSVANVFKALQDVVGEGAFGSANFSAKAEIGLWSVLIRVSQYNGEENDAQVQVALYQTNWDGTGKTPQPVWDGTDIWPVATTSLADGMTIDDPQFVDKAAYVSGGVVVASLPEAYLGLNDSGSSLGVRLTAGTLIGRIEKAAKGYRLVDGVIGGRWKADDIFKVLGSFSVSGQALCTDAGLAYKRFKEVVCGNVDIASVLGGATTPCDSLSIGMKYSTEPAGVDVTYVPEMEMPPCSKATDPANDSCDSLL